MFSQVSRIFSGLVFAYILLTMLAQPLSALDEEASSEVGCDGAATMFYAGSLQSPKNVYDVYIKLGTRGQRAAVSVHVQTDEYSETCELVGSADASGDEWRKLGSYSESGVATATFQVASSALSDIPTANRPTLMLLPRDTPACVPKSECETAIDGQLAYIRAPSNTLADNALRIVRVSDLDSSAVVKVKYYVDNELMYTTKQLEDFDLRSVPYYGNKLIRVVEYASGQSAVIESSIPKDHIDTLSSALVRVLRKYRDAVLVAVAVVLVLVFVKLVRVLVVHMEHHHEWMVAHGLVRHKPEPVLTPERKKMLHRRQVLRGVYGAVQVAVVIALLASATVLVLSTYVVQIASVSGQSMVSSYRDGQTIVINRLPVTTARINNEFYTPQRGEVVVAYPGFGGGEAISIKEADDTVIKRVIGLPGDRVVLSGGKITIYNETHPDGFDPSFGTKWAERVQPDATALYLDITLAENEVFICGDNRPESIDSRFNGPITTSQIVGVVHEL